MATPDFRLSLNGTDLSARVRPRLVQLTLTEKRGAEADQLDITLADHDGRLAIPPAGARLLLQLGWQAGAGVAIGLVDKGEFLVDEVECSGSPDVLVIRARSADFTAAARIRRVAAATGKTLGQIVNEVAGRMGVVAQVAPALAGVAVPVLDQPGLSDLALLRALGRRHDAVATIKAGRLLFTPVGAGTTASGTALPGTSITRQDGDQHSWRRATRDSYSGVSAEWHDPAAATRRRETAGDASNAKHLAGTFGNQADAQAAAAAEHRQQQRTAATMGLTLALARPDIYPEQRVQLQGWGKPQIDGGKWLVTETRHDLSDRGFTTQLGLETAI